MTIFDVAAEQFLSLAQNRSKVVAGLLEVPKSSSVRILQLQNIDGHIEIYVIKDYSTGGFKDYIRWLENEIAAQAVLTKLGLQAKRFVVVRVDLPEGSRRLAVSDYISGEILEEVDKKTLLQASLQLCSYLFRLHSNTLSTTYGFLDCQVQVSSVGEVETGFLRADLARDRISLGIGASRGLEKTKEVLNQLGRFCFCHCDVTLRNSLWDSGQVHLIDWAIARFTHPAYDIAHVLFWLVEEGFQEVAREEYEKAESRYHTLGFSLAEILPFYLGQRYIEFGRIRGKKYINRGKEILASLENSWDVKNLLHQS